MKTIALVFALGTFTFAGVQASIPALTPTVNIQVLQDRTEINPEDLPQVVKDTIAENEETKALTISEAYQLTDVEGTITYEVTFGLEEEGTITKKYDNEGNEIVDA